MDNEKFGGWTNHPTWLVVTHIMNNYEFDKDDEIICPEGMLPITISDIALFLKEEVVENVLTDFGNIEDDSIALFFAREFMGDVHFYEIAEHLVKEDPSWLKPKGKMKNTDNR